MPINTSLSSGGSSTATQVDYTPIFEELLGLQFLASDANFTKYVAAKLFSNVSFNLDHRPVRIIANECVTKAKALTAACKNL